MFTGTQNQTFDRVEIRQPKQAPKEYKPMANAAAPVTTPPLAATSTAPLVPVPVPASDTTMPAATTDQSATAQPPLHPYSGIPNRYALPAQKNFAAPDKRQEGLYRPTVPVYDIEKSNHVFSCIMKSAITLSVEELCSIAPNVHNQMKMAVTPKRTMQATVQDTDNIDNTLPGFTLSALPPNAKDSVAKATSVDPVETYFKLLAPDDKHAILTITQDSQAIRSIMLMVDNKSEVEAIVDSGSQIISMSADVANELGIIYNPTIHLNMQRTNALAYLYLTTSDNFDKYSANDTYLTTLPDSPCPAALGLTKARNCTSDLSNNLSSYITAPKQKGVQVKKKYKPVALKTKPVTSSVSKDFRTKQKIIGDPLADMPLLTPNPPSFIPTGRFTDEQQKQFIADYNKGFLTTAKLNVLDLMAKQNKAFAWEDSEHGSLHTDFFSPVVIPTIPHIP
ncbi:hypothetical protein C0992_008225 [Termitomyces sp. T32_za158]|nr:hypothetical protein C0992_008225 [Termitomyces sp. T32_za158]